jgi:hypothetical protein
MIDQAKHTAEEVGEQVGEVVEQVKEHASTRLSAQIGQTSEGLHSASEAIRSVGRELRNQQVPLAQYADRAADQVDRASTYLRDKDLDQLIADVEEFARRNPATFIGGAFALGIIGARFMKSTPEQRQVMLDRGSQLDQRRAALDRNQQETPSQNRPSELPRHEPPPGSFSTRSPAGSSSPISSPPSASVAPSSTTNPSSTDTPVANPPPSSEPRSGGMTGDEDTEIRRSA